MKTLIWFMVYVIVINYVGFEMLSNLDTGGPNDKRHDVVKVQLAPVSLYTPKVFSPDDPQVKCLAENIYHEARGETERGRLAVAFVTINRANSVHYPDTICKVVYQPYQFSWTNQNPRPEVNLKNPIERKAWEEAKRLALDVMNGKYENTLYGVTHYHSKKVKPKWRRVKKRTEIGEHVFYASY